MGLILPPWTFNSVSSNLPSTPASSSPLSSAVTSGTSNADGTAVTLLSALAHDVHYLTVGFGEFFNNASLVNALADILVDPAGGSSWSSFIDDLVCGFTRATGFGASNASMNQWYCFPVFVKAGSSLGVRVRSNDTVARTGDCTIYAYGDPSRPDMWWCGQKVESLGIDAANSKGADVTGGANDVYGSWTTIGTSGHPYGALQFGVNASDASAVARGYYWQIGYGSTKLPGSPTFYISSNAAEYKNVVGMFGPIWCDIAASTALQARYASSGTAPDVYNCAFYGVY